MRRDVALSMFPDIVAEKATGPILKSVFRGTNADLMAAVAPMYLTGSVLDVTYGNGATAGGWWRRFTPNPFAFHDLALDGVDFRALPEADGSADTVCFDPPYVPSGGASTTGPAAQFRTRFGIDRTTHYGREDEAVALITDGVTEACRVASQFVLAKAMEFVSSHQFHDAPTEVITTARALGWVLHDRIVHDTGTGPGGHNIFTVKRARRAHSYLLVFTPGSNR